MIAIHQPPLNLEDFIQATELSTTTIIEIIEQGIIEPEGQDQEHWRFDTRMIVVTKKALRLHQDLQLDWAGIALALQLIDEMEQLRAENQHLQRRLNWFIKH
jgi:chaperone modulatory protein CbpM